uniref:MBD domain-containing protein n=1 Tax=Triticum urartu TaxID=4572 RepID=A0A8R7TPS0_TRIUA
MLQGEKRGEGLMAAEKPIIKAHHLGNGNIEYYTSPITSMMSMMKNKVTQYRRFKKRVIRGRSTCGDVKTLQGNYSWIPEGWAMEIRAEGEGVNKKIFKFFVHKSSGVRFTNKDDVEVFEKIVRVPKMPLPSKEDGSKQDVSKKDVLLFEEPIKKRKTPRACKDAVECDTSSQDNMIAQLDFYTERLSAGWVKETYFRPDDKKKKDTYFTDPSSSEYLVFRTKKDATKYFWTGERPKDSWKPTQSVTKKYKDLLVIVADEKDLDGQHEPKQKKPKTTSTEADEAMTCSQAGLLGINQGQEKN